MVKIRRPRRQRGTRRLTRGERRLSTAAALLVAIGASALVGLLIDPSLERKVSNGLQTLGDLTPGASASTLTGKASVIDGDTIEIHGQPVRFDGIDAPEASQNCKDQTGKAYKCGQEAALFLDKFIAVSSPVRCEFVSWDQYHRFVGECFRADGASLNAAMVRSGYALDWPKHSKGKYAGFQRDARKEKAGMWAGSFEPAWDYRARQQLVAPQKPATAEPSPPAFAVAKPAAAPGNGSGCDIKGNISVETGERIYHVPGQRFYAKTRISPQKGERWFCSEDEAIQAGWRRSRQ